MHAAIEYEDGELKFFTEFENVEDYIKCLRQEVVQNANKRSYHFYIGEHMKKHAEFKNGEMHYFKPITDNGH